jgi:hypothetical protein
MRRRGRRRYNVVWRCSGGVPAVGALLESAPVLNFHGLASHRFARAIFNRLDCFFRMFGSSSSPGHDEDA